jgi:hypothetical protein
VLNAGLLFPNDDTRSADGFEAAFAGKGNEKLPVINTNSAIFSVLLFCAEKNPTWPSGGTS